MGLTSAACATRSGPQVHHALTFASPINGKEMMGRPMGPSVRRTCPPYSRTKRARSKLVRSSRPVGVTSTVSLNDAP